MGLIGQNLLKFAFFENSSPEASTVAVERPRLVELIEALRISYICPPPPQLPALLLQAGTLPVEAVSLSIIATLPILDVDVGRTAPMLAGATLLQVAFVRRRPTDRTTRHNLNKKMKINIETSLFFIFIS